MPLTKKERAELAEVTCEYFAVVAAIYAREQTQDELLKESARISKELRELNKRRDNLLLELEETIWALVNPNFKKPPHVNIPVKRQ